MALPSSGALTLNAVHVEIGGTGGSSISMNDLDFVFFAGKNQGDTISLSEFYGLTYSTQYFYSRTTPLFTWRNDAYNTTLWWNGTQVANLPLNTGLTAVNTGRWVYRRGSLQSSEAFGDYYEIGI